MLKKIYLFIIAISILMSAGYSHASGFRTFVLSARAATLGGAFVARADDPSAIYYNPAGIAFLDGIRIKVNVLYNDLKTTANYEGATSKIESDYYQFGGSYFFSWQLKDKISFGVGGFVPYSMDTNWPPHWRGNTLVDNSTLSAFYIRPVVAFKIFDRLSVGAGLDFVLSRVRWDHNVIFQSDVLEGVEANVLSKFDVSGSGTGFGVGLLYKVSDKLRIGCKYQHRVEIDLKGDNSYMVPGANALQLYLDLSWPDLVLLAELMEDFYTTYKVTSVITMPSELVLGFMYSLTDKLTFQLDVQWTEWSKIKTWEFIAEREDEPDYSMQSMNFSWKDALSFKLGAEFYLSDFIALRAGYTNQQSSLSGDVLSPILLDLDRNTVSFGFGYEGPMFDIFDVDRRTGGFSFDLFFQYVFADSRTSSLFGIPVSYRGNRWTFGIGVGFNFGSL